MVSSDEVMCKVVFLRLRDEHYLRTNAESRFQENLLKMEGCESENKKIKSDMEANNREVQHLVSRTELLEKQLAEKKDQLKVSEEHLNNKTKR